MSKSTDIRPTGVRLHFIPVEMRMPLKFGAETLTHLTSARVCMTVRTSRGREARGWGETPLSVQWVWPSPLSYEERFQALSAFCVELTAHWPAVRTAGHPVEIGYAFLHEVLPSFLADFNSRRAPAEPMPWLAALVCSSAFDMALHDAYGNLHNVSVYQTYNRTYMNSDLAAFLTPATGAANSFQGKFPAEFLVSPRPDSLAAWHLVGGKDPIDAGELDGSEPRDGHPVLLTDWIRTDGLKCLKIKLRGNDAAWDYARLVKVGEVAIRCGADWLSTDFNCLVTDPLYVNEILDRLMVEHPRIYGMILYVEQPFPYDLEEHEIDVHSVAARKPLFMDESAHDWRLVRAGRELGWTGVALKTCKTQTGALLSLCWAKVHGMTLMVQDLTNSMLAQVSHVQLAAHAGTIMGVETNSMQFCPDASHAEAAVHPGIYRRRNGSVDLSTVRGPGIGYRIDEIQRALGEPAASAP